MPQPCEVLARLKDGKIAGLSARLSETTESGKTIEGDPIPLSGLDDPIFMDFAKLFSAQAVAERDAAKADGATALKAAADAKALVDGALTTANEQIATLQKMVAAAEGRVAKAEAKVAALTASVAQLTADCQAAIAAQPIGDLSDTLSPLERLYFGLALKAKNAAIATGNDARAARNAAKAGGEEMEALVAPLSPSVFFARLVSAAISSLGTKEAQVALIHDAIPKLVALPDHAQVGALTLLAGQKAENASDLATIAALPAEQRPAMLRLAVATIQAAITALGDANPAARDTLIVQVMGV